MAVAKLAGQGASARKYDLLTVIGAAALGAEPAVQRQALRFMTLITARYDWRRDLLATGVREIAALWSVDERTAKRELARLRDRGWLILRRQGARGRVSEYALGLAQILEDTRAYWPQVGRDLVERLSPPDAPVPAGTKSRVIPFPQNSGTPWDRASSALAAADPDLHSAWVRQLEPVSMTDGEVVLRAPSRFHASYVQNHLGARLLGLCAQADPSLQNLRVEVQ